MSLNIAIVGGSIAGLCAAAGLIERGFNVTIFERSAGALAARGAGIAFDPELLPYLASDDGLELRGRNINGRVVVGPSGKTLWHRPAVKFMTSWSEIYRALKRKIPQSCVRNGIEVVSCEEVVHETHTDETRDGEKPDRQISLVFDNGESGLFDLLIGADGVGSCIRDYVAPGFEPHYMGYVAIRGILPEHQIPATAQALIEKLNDPGLVNIYSSQSHAVCYWIPTSNYAALNWMWYVNVEENRLKDFLQDKHGTGHRWSLAPGEFPNQVRMKLLQQIRENYPVAFADVAQATPDIFAQAIYRGIPQQLKNGRAVLIGDAAHIAVPHVGAGVSLAMRDAIALSKILDPQALDESLEEWTNERRESVENTLEAAVRLGRSVQFGSHDWESWTEDEFDLWWDETMGGRGLYFEAKNSHG